MNNQLCGRNLAHGIDTGRWLSEHYASPERALIPEVHEGKYSLNPSFIDGQTYNSSPGFSNDFQTLDTLVISSGLTSIAD